MRQSIYPLAVAVALMAVAGATLAHEGATGVAKERMDLMGSMSKDMQDIAKHVNANRDLPAIAGLAARIGETARKISGFFPEGSGTGITDAKPEIWQYWDRFQGKVQKLQEQSGALASAASSGDPQSIGAQFTAVIRACTSCHTDFRRGKADRY
jgi:cytochrome c556